MAEACVAGSVNEIVSTTRGLGVLGTGDEHLGYVAWIEDDTTYPVFVKRYNGTIPIQ